MNCILSAALAAIMALGFVSGARALPITFNLSEELSIPTNLDKAFINLVLGGSITLDDEDFLDFGANGPAFKPLTDYDLLLTYDIDLGNGLEPIRIPITPNTSSAVLNGRTTLADENAIMIDASGVPGFTPLFDIQVDKFLDANNQPTDFGFPNGKRLGDDVTDLLLIQLFKGSINLGVAAFTDGFTAPPGLVEVRQLTSADSFTLAAATNSVSTVSLPTPLSLSAAALGLFFWTSRRRRIV